MSAYKFPYRARVMICYGDGAPMELHRFSRPPVPSDVSYWTRDRETDGHVYIEYHCQPSELISERPIPQKIVYACDRKTIIPTQHLEKIDIPPSWRVL